VPGDGTHDPPQNADELATLRGFLDHHRETFRGEYARHNGHADLIRASLDGRTGE
jgi:hypothetical protein